MTSKLHAIVKTNNTDDLFKTAITIYSSDDMIVNIDETDATANKNTTKAKIKMIA